MSRLTPEVDAADSTNVRTAWRRLALLVLLVMAAFRGEWVDIFRQAIRFSDWSHALALPLFIGAFCWLRRDDLRAALTVGSSWGLVLVILGALVWFATKSLGLFGYLLQIAMLCAVAGVIVTACGGKMARMFLPVLLMLASCLPLSERSMERFSVATQRVSLFGAVTILKAAPGIDVSTHGTTITYESGDQSGDIGLGEQRFAFRLIPAAFMVGLFVVFSRCRPAWQIVLLVLVSVPLVLLSNVIRIVASSLVTIYGNYSPLSNAPRNASIVVGLLAAPLLFGLACWVLDRVARLGALFYVDDDSAAPDGVAS